MPDSGIYHTIKQGLSDGMCAVCAVAMATGATTDDVYEFLNDGRIHGDPICSADEAMFLLSRGWVRGGGHEILSGNRYLTRGTELVRTLAGVPALLDVQSNNHKELEHAVFWDGSVCRDPDPRVPDTTTLWDYHILRVWPLTRVMEIHYCKRIQLSPRPTPQFVLDSRVGLYTEAYT